ncbi:hypothetical protein E2C01_051860 [Portunus trituberculatus]|uniref:Uncharacterized protein n=1 Tax=Portunus trituberculatus TaxID=210409 RepID=A0A5B7GG10_PORTR|nr:hypothetical protein [Portunus trituberculatus]
MRGTEGFLSQAVNYDIMIHERPNPGRRRQVRREDNSISVTIQLQRSISVELTNGDGSFQEAGLREGTAGAGPREALTNDAKCGERPRKLNQSREEIINTRANESDVDGPGHGNRNAGRTALSQCRDLSRC